MSSVTGCTSGLNPTKQADGYKVGDMYRQHGNTLPELPKGLEWSYAHSLESLPPIPVFVVVRTGSTSVSSAFSPGDVHEQREGEALPTLPKGLEWEFQRSIEVYPPIGVYKVITTANKASRAAAWQDESTFVG